MGWSLCVYTGSVCQIGGTCNHRLCLGDRHHIFISCNGTSARTANAGTVQNKSLADHLAAAAAAEEGTRRTTHAPILVAEEAAAQATPESEE